MTKQEALKIINQVGEDFGWQMGKVGANYENGYMKAIRDVKNAFDKVDHFVEVNKMIANKEKIGMLKECIRTMCESDECINCSFFNPSDEEFTKYPCSIIDKYKGFPFYKTWDIESALGVDQFREDTKKVVTNADRIRNMTDEELAELLAESNTLIKCKDCSEPMNEWGSCIGNCENAYLKWLKEKVE